MISEVFFCIGNNQIEVNEKPYSLGELSTEILNITPEVYHEWWPVFDSARKALEQYEETSDPELWHAAHQKYLELDAILSGYSALSLFCMQPPMREFIEGAMAKHPRIDLTSSEWMLCRKVYDRYDLVMSDISSFNITIHNFINQFSSHLIKLDASNYAAALNAFMYSPYADKYIANPARGTGLYLNSDTVVMRYHPRETFPGSDEYKIYEYYEVEYLQTLLKIDFYKALEAGYIIRRCEYCKRYFLLKKAYHTKYCDNPAPDNPKYTCAQLGYHSKGIKELAGNNPKAQSLRRCCQRIEKDHYRGIISDEDKELLLQTAKDLYHRAIVSSGISNEEFEASLAGKVLYPACNVERLTASRGRPKKQASINHK